MKRSFHLFAIACMATCLAVLNASVASSQLQSANTIDFDNTPIISCASNGALPPNWQIVCNTPGLLEAFLDDLIEAEAFLDQLIIGYRNDLPSFVANQLDDPLLMLCQIDGIDGPGGTLAQAGPVQSLNFLPNPFLRLRGGFRAWSLPRLSIITFDCDDVFLLVVTDGMVEVAVHEAFHAMGHPSNFDAPSIQNGFQGSGLNLPINVFNQINFVGDPAGINGIGFGVTEYRAESGNPFASFVPLQQDVMPGETPGHLSPFDPTFVRPAELLQEVFIPTAPPPGTQAFMSRALQGMFADLGYRVTGVNAPGFLDIDQDGIEDPVLIINPELPTDP